MSFRAIANLHGEYNNSKYNMTFSNSYSPARELLY